jgi:hypothetical protein
MTELPPIRDDVPIYWGDVPLDYVPAINFGRRPTAIGPAPEGLTFHEVFPSSPTTQTLRQMRVARPGAGPRGQVQGAQGEIFVLEGAGPLSTRGGTGLRDPITNRLRFPDVRQPTYNGRTLAFEAKNYSRWLTAPGRTRGTLREVPFSNALQQQVTGDAFLMNYGPGNHRPVWVFVHAPPAAELANYLRLARIPYIVYGDMFIP